MRFFAASCLLLLAALGLATPSLAAYRPTLTQYAHTAWRVQDGDFEGQATSIAQTRDGYLWVGTEGGLERYDGARFRHWTLPRPGPVYSVLADRDGSLWVGRGVTLLHLRSGDVIDTIQVGGRTTGLYQNSAGAIWLARIHGPAHGGGLCKVEGSAVRCFGDVQGQPCNFGDSLAQDAEGDFLIGSAAGVCKWRPGEVGKLSVGGGAAPGLAGVQALKVETDGSVLIGYLQSGARFGLQRMSGAVLTPYLATGLNGGDLHVASLLRDRDDALWIGATDNGIYHVYHGKVDHFSRADGLSGSYVNAMFEDREGSVWVATSGGLDRFHRHAVASLTTREGLSAETANSVLARQDGSIWIGANDGLNIIRDGAVVAPPKGFSGRAVTSMAEDHAGRLWLGLDEDLAVFDGRTIRIVRKADGRALGPLVGLAEDGLHDIWAIATGRPSRLYRVHGSEAPTEVQLPGNREPERMATGPGGAIWLVDKTRALEAHQNGGWLALGAPHFAGAVGSITVAPNDDVIVSTGAGAYYLRNGAWTLLDKGRELPCDIILSATVDLQGVLWLRGDCGLISIARSDLEKGLRDPREKLRVRWLDGADGAQPGEGSFSPRAAISRDGQLWFATDNVPLTINPANLQSNPLAPPVHIEQVVADHRVYPVGRSISFPPRTRDVEISYSGLSLVAPQKTRYRYRLSGVDDGWQDVGTRRTAFYMNLKPGRYRFQVVASNNDGVWNTTGDIFDFAIRPTFFQTLWFQALALLLIFGLVWLGFWLRVRFVAAEIEARLSERQAERMRIARELHDTLLQGFQGLLMRFQVVADAIPKRAPAKSMMEEVLSRAEDVLIEGRDRVHDLRTAEDNPSALLDALLRMALELEQNGCGPIDILAIGVPRSVDENIQREIVAIAREALINACRHAQATQIVCQVTFSRFHVRVSCEDNGIGIAAGTLSAGGREGHWGLPGMRERARQAGGVLALQSIPGQTRVTFSLNTWAAALRGLGKRLSWLAAKT